MANPWWNVKAERRRENISHDYKLGRYGCNDSYLLRGYHRKFQAYGIGYAACLTGVIFWNFFLQICRTQLCPQFIISACCRFLQHVQHATMAKASQGSVLIKSSAFMQSHCLNTWLPTIGLEKCVWTEIRGAPHVSPQAAF